MSISDETWLVTGATGSIGSAFVKEVAKLARPPRLRIATRSPLSPRAKLLSAFRAGAIEPVAMTDEPGSVKTACAGISRAFVVAPFMPDKQTWHRALAEALEASGCEYAVKVSVTGASPPPSDPPPPGIPYQHWLG